MYFIFFDFYCFNAYLCKSMRIVQVYIGGTLKDHK